MRTEANRYQFIDALRGMAFLGVLCCHISTKVDNIPGPIFRIVNHLSCGVQLFFIVSALTLFLSFDARKSSEARPLLNFYLRRFFRIAPLFYAAAIFYLAAFPGHRFDPNMPEEITPGSVISTLTFTHGLCPSWINQVVPGGWSISVEMSFYLIVPFLYRGLKSIGRTLKALVAAEVFALLVTFVIKNSNYYYIIKNKSLMNAFTSFYFPRQFPIFLLGIVLYFLIKDKRKNDHPEGQDTEPMRFRRSVVMFIISIFLYILISLNQFVGLNTILFGMALLLAAWALATYPLRVVVNPLFCYLGKVSFSAYLVHFAILEFIDSIIRNNNYIIINNFILQLCFMGLLSLVGTVAIASLTSRLIELPCQALGKRIIELLEKGCIVRRPSQTGWTFVPILPRERPKAWSGSSPTGAVLSPRPGCGLVGPHRRAVDVEGDPVDIAADVEPGVRRVQERIAHPSAAWLSLGAMLSWNRLFPLYPRTSKESNRQL
jgi:peptidoglycan/LPS O-acetylase OafA/YrhL